MLSATIKLFLVHGDAKRMRAAELVNWIGKAVAGPRSELAWTMHAFPTAAADLPSRFRAPGASSATGPSGTGARLGRARRRLRGLPSVAASST